MTRFPVAALRSVDLVVPDLDHALDFYGATWGLEQVDRRGDTAWLRATGDDPHVLALTAGPASAITSMTFRADADADLAQLHQRLLSAGATPIHDTQTLDEPGEGAAIAVRDPVGRTIRVVRDDARAAASPPAPDRAERLAHVNFNSDDVARDTRFFVDGLGFQLTDRSKMMAFVRTNSDHHSIVISEAPVNTLNHVAFAMPTWEAVMKGAGRLCDAGFGIGWGPGRHGPGDNVFTYFVDPFGIVVEYTAEVLQVDDGYRVGTPEDWVWPAGRTDQWGIAPPKSAACKAAQLAIPFA